MIAFSKFTASMILIVFAIPSAPRAPWLCISMTGYLAFSMLVTGILKMDRGW